MKQCVTCKENKPKEAFYQWRASCKACAMQEQKRWQAKNSDKVKKYKAKCAANSGYKKYRKMLCEQCGFSPLHICQLDVDHIDGNHNNNDPSNLKTLCANCHRLKTHLNRDYRKRY